jgi:hypothetical protein
VQRQVQSLSALGRILRDGLDLVDGEHGTRMQTAHAVFSWLDDVFAAAPPLPSGNDPTRRRRREHQVGERADRDRPNGDRGR